LSLTTEADAHLSDGTQTPLPIHDTTFQHPETVLFDQDSRFLAVFSSFDITTHTKYDPNREKNMTAAAGPCVGEIFSVKKENLLWNTLRQRELGIRNGASLNVRSAWFRAVPSRLAFDFFQLCENSVPSMLSHVVLGLNSIGTHLCTRTLL
jgi:hypothetical protein